MGWRSVIVENPAKLSLNNNQLLIQQDEHYSIPLEDIETIILENRQINITASLLSKLAENEIALFTCDDKHMPNGLFLPFEGHCKQTQVVRTQLNLTEPFKKRCWQKIISQKILNQARCLELSGRPNVNELIRISRTVESGDKSNREAYAAKIYFKSLFGDGFSRSLENSINAGLNYGYAIFRGALARAVVAFGFIPALGLKHSNQLNGFNLADDLIEAFRPLVDLWVAEKIDGEEEFSKKNRLELVELLHFDCLIDNEKQSVLRAIQVMVASFSTACRLGDYKCLKLPEILPFSKVHHYE